MDSESQELPATCKKFLQHIPCTNRHGFGKVIAPVCIHLGHLCTTLARETKNIGPAPGALPLSSCPWLLS